jgi:hypothetical protein
MLFLLGCILAFVGQAIGLWGWGHYRYPGVHFWSHGIAPWRLGDYMAKTGVVIFFAGELLCLIGVLVIALSAK